MKPDGEYMAITEPQLLWGLAQHLAGFDEIAVDTETTGLDVTKDHLLGISISETSGVGYWIPLDKSQLPDVNYQMGLFEPEMGIQIEHLQEYLGPILANPNIKKYIHNIKFDVPLLRRYGLEVVNYMDTYIAAWVLGNRKGRRYGLKALTKEKFGIEQPDLYSLLKKYGSFQAIPIELATEYAGADSDMTLRHGEMLSDALVHYPALNETLVMEHELAMVLWENEQTGILVDAEKLEERADDLAAGMEVAKEDFHAAAGTDPEKFNIASNKQVKQLLVKWAKEHDITSVSHEVLKDMDNRYGIPWVAPLLEYRDFAKTRSTFVEGIYERIREDGRLETSFQQAGIATGRLSSRDPNLQNIPKQYRDVFIVPKDYYMVAIDFSGMELRILATLANEERMLNAFNEGIDVHTMTASLVFDIPYDEIGKKSKERAAAKTVGFGLVYGMTEFKLARTLDIPIDEAKKLLDKYFNVFTGVRDYMSTVHYQLMRHGWVENAYGRRRYFPVKKYAHDDRMMMAFKREAGNFPIQSLNAEITKRSLIDIHNFLTEEGWRSRQISSIHDEIIWEVHKDEVDELVPRFVRTMENIFPLKVPTIAEVGIGHNMAEACLDEENWELYLKGEWS